MSYTIEREDMVEPVDRMFEREYEADQTLVVQLDEETEGGSGSIDMVYVQGGAEEIHAIRFEEDYEDCVFDVREGALHALRDVEANYRWVALPLYEFRDGEDQYSDVMKEECEKRGFGVISAQKKGRGVSAKVLMAPSRVDGDFLDGYPPVRDQWGEAHRGETAPGSYKVVDYY